MICDVKDCEHQMMPDKGEHNPFGSLCTPHHEMWIEFLKKHDKGNIKNPEVRRFYVAFLLNKGKNSDMI